MNTTSLKTFAPTVRIQLMEAVTRKLDFVLSAQTPDYLSTFAPQVAALRKLAAADRAGLVERVAYTWFNRLAAIRFLDARGWHPFRARVLTPAGAEETQPELLKVTRAGSLPEELENHTDPQRLNELLDGRIPSSNAQGEVYRHLVLAACRFYHDLLPSLFEKLDDETELLLPDDVLTEQSVAQGFRTEISDEDCSEVEILGWLYQFYISEKKDAVMARKSSVPTEDIPAVTQLFTPHWIVRYLVENSLGRLWLLNRPGSRLREHMPYYIEGEKNATGGSPDDFLKITKPEEIRLCDPAVGSGHMLTYAFDLLTLIYEEEGYAPTEIPALILRHNLHGLEICPRAAQLAELALVFKAREKSRRFFQPEHLVRPHLIELKDIRFEEGELSAYFKALDTQPSTLNPQLTKLLHQFEEAKNFGSLIQPCLDEQAIVTARRAIEAKDLGGQLFLRETHLKVLRALEQAEALTQRYHVVVANPPYLAGTSVSASFKAFLENSYEDGKADVFAAFIYRSFGLLIPNGFAGFMTPFVWMFINSFAKLRQHLINRSQFLCLVRPEYNAFWASAHVAICAFAFRNTRPAKESKAVFIDLKDFMDKDVQAARTREAIKDNKSKWRFEANPSDFRKIAGAPFAYWASDTVRNVYGRSNAFRDVVPPKAGISTGENERFILYWTETSMSSVGFGQSERSPMFRFYPHNKAGGFRRWYGNTNYILNYDDKAILEMESRRGFRHDGESYYFRPSVSWGKITSSHFSARVYPAGFTFDSAGISIFPQNQTLFVALLNSRVFSALLAPLSQTLNFTVGDIGRFPLPDNVLKLSKFEAAERAISLSEKDWSNFETAWEFLTLPFLRPGLKGATLEASWRNWEALSADAIRRMQELETENNRLWIDAYGLRDELTPEVPEDEITLTRADKKKDAAAFLSYAVGCMMGRYSIDHPGLILANAGDTLREFLEKVGEPLAELTFTPDEDGIIPVLDGEWFEDDIAARTREFLRVTFGEATLRENIRFIEDSLGKDLRKYFLNDFYKDHLKTYKKRPIFWMIQSPKKGFNALIYLHRYTKDTMNGVLNRYLRDYQAKLRNRLAHVTEQQATTATAKAKTEARKEADKITKILHECEEWERQTMLPLAQARIELDLDDGVKVNYLKLGEALAPIAGLAKKEKP